MTLPFATRLSRWSGVIDIHPYPEGGDKENYHTPCHLDSHFHDWLHSQRRYVVLRQANEVIFEVRFWPMCIMVAVVVVVCPERK